jgi:hypothetical protein
MSKKRLRSVALLFAIGAGFALVIVFGSPACSSNNMAKNFGGTMTVNLPPGQKLVTATWKDDEFWYLARPMRLGEVPETSTFQEKSSAGLVEGKVILIEHSLK